MAGSFTQAANAPAGKDHVSAQKAAEEISFDDNRRPGMLILPTSSNVSNAMFLKEN
jgi:hypothetical protein